jgi:hypothetical protein
MEKTAKQLLDEGKVIKLASQTIRSLTDERDALATKVAAYEHRERAAKVASAYHARGIDTDVPVEELTERLSKEASAQLDVFEKAASLHMGDATSRFAQLSEGSSAGGATSALNNYILS